MEPIQKPISHYYGDIVRIIFIIGAVFMLWGLSRMTELLNIPAWISILAIAILGIAAGITNPVQKRSLQMNATISVFFMMIFAYTAWYAHTESLGQEIEIANQIAAILFLAASYFSIKSLRGANVPEKI